MKSNKDQAKDAALEMFRAELNGDPDDVFRIAHRLSRKPKLAYLVIASLVGGTSALVVDQAKAYSDPAAFLAAFLRGIEQSFEADA